MDIPRPEDVPGASQNQDQLQTQQHVRKRRRTQLACNSCRQRKTACNGDRPSCSSCIRRGVQDSCSYEEATVGSKASINTGKSLMISSPKPNVHFQSVSQSTSSPSLAVGTAASPGNVGGLAMVSDTETQGSLYGGSSTIALVSQVRQAASDQAVPINETDRPSIDSLPQPHGEVEILHKQDVANFVLPQRQQADEFLKCYWEFVHPVFPLLDLRTFNATYERLWLSSPGKGLDGDELNETIFHATLNLVFALGCQYSKDVPPQRKSSYADELYRRSRRLLNFEILDALQLSLVQLFLLTGVYLQSTEHANRCWNVVGLAIRTAQGLGLNTENNSHRTSQSGYEIKRRVWHCCILLDRLLAMTFGRPTMIRSGSYDVPEPSIIDDQYLTADSHQVPGAQPSGVHSRMNLFVYSLRLFDIMDEILSKFYVFQGSKSESNLAKSFNPWSVDDLASILNINAKLDDFRGSVPQIFKDITSFALRTDAFAPGQLHVVLQSKVLRSRFLLVRILLLRPVLLASVFKEKSALLAKSEPGLTKDLAIGVCTLCVKSAHLLVETIHENLNTEYRSSGWHTVYFAFAAATILLAAQLSPLIRASLYAEHCFETSWTSCIEILEHHKVQIQSAKRAINILETLKEKVQARKSAEIMNPLNGNPLGSNITGNPTHAEQHITNPQDSIPQDYSAIVPGVPNGELGNDNIIMFDTGMQMDSMNDAWFTQQLSDLNWLDYYQVSPQ
ncbi:putative transcriptional regulatory protein [Botrytis cinerea BcDW1]|uniref:Similar to transcription factor Cys6 n=2 Tax=Botryotinia fuckeliana TaxID=40559 RepID=G2YB61_BOTF4|nr:putative transcriptional regulatory protein [Botrytis cinerea BcDW1]CCD34452.1 similar to transcription factor Cys6 [Botrytis cinerea T4]